MDFDKSTLLSFSANFCKYISANIATQQIKIKVKMPNGVLICSLIKSGILPISRSIIKQAFMIIIIK